MFDSWPGGSWEATAKFVVAVLAIYLAAIWVALVFWTYRDIRQRTRDPILQTVAVLLVLIFFLPGHWVYLIVRPRFTLTELYERSLEEESLLQELEDQKACPTCKRRVVDDYLICPSCRTQLKEPCRQCSKPLSYAWVACPYCGLEKPPREGFGPRPVRSPQPRQQAAPPPSARPQPTPQPRPASAAPQPVPQATPRPMPRPAPEQPVQAPARPNRDPFGTRPQAQPGAADDGPVIGE
ncbi:MAG: zinc ribbon domain-containing protein [Dehalococcoidia bacterium]|nr:zinc ribbon domain-containing protein [Dehalococcoidia bacterium]